MIIILSYQLSSWVIVKIFHLSLLWLSLHSHRLLNLIKIVSFCKVTTKCRLDSSNDFVPSIPFNPWRVNSSNRSIAELVSAVAKRSLLIWLVENWSNDSWSSGECCRRRGPWCARILVGRSAASASVGRPSGRLAQTVRACSEIPARGSRRRSSEGIRRRSSWSYHGTISLMRVIVILDLEEKSFEIINWHLQIRKNYFCQSL